MFSVTTPIYYVNDEPHLGHAYCTILADVLARYHRLRGEPVFFLTGVDEHGQKVQNAVKKHGIAEPQAYVDVMAERFRETWAGLEIRYDDFIRTTEPRHRQVVQAVLQQLWDAGQIYRGEYEGWYCVPDERFWTEKDLKEGNLCPDCGRPVERITEYNYFFRMGQYQDWLIGYIQEHPDFIQPEYRRNEVLGFLRKPLGDLCISRPVSRLSWGIPLPFDPQYVTYVWFDALLNYVTAQGYLQDTARFEQQWPHTLHLIGKDILTTHAVYWPTMLKAIGLPMPKAIFATGWWVIGGAKMSKSLGNAVRPLDLAQIYGVDAFRYFLLRDMVLGQDADFDAERVASRYNVDLANNLGNLLQRVTSMAARYCDGNLPAPFLAATAEDETLHAQIDGLAERVFARVDAYQLNEGLALCMDALTAANGYLERTAPWKLYKAGEGVRVGDVLANAAEVLRLAAHLLSPVMPEKCAEVLRRLHGPICPGEPIFPRVEAA